jgi:hypothetical protein
MPGMFKAFFSEGKFHEIQEEIRQSSYLPLDEQGGSSNHS